MCGIVLTTESVQHAEVMLGAIRHRGTTPVVGSCLKGRLHYGFTRLRIFDDEDADIYAASQPYRTPRTVTMFNGELYNYHALIDNLLVQQAGLGVPAVGRSEVAVLDHLMRNYSEFYRLLDGYYAAVQVDLANQKVTLTRDLLGVMPLYYQKPVGALPFAVASEAKALVSPVEVPPATTMVFSASGKFLTQRKFDPWMIGFDPVDPFDLADHLASAVEKRVLHRQVPVSIALSGGLDSSLVLVAARDAIGDPQLLDAITVGFDVEDIEVQNAMNLCAHLGVPFRFVKLTDAVLEDEKARILYMLEDHTKSRIKTAAMIRNYFVAKHAKGTVILCGEGADELGCGYPSHQPHKGIDLSFKALSTLRSMHSINLDRVNKGGMAFTKEFRVPFLDRELLQYQLMHRMEYGKVAWKTVGSMWKLPSSILNKQKYGKEESHFWNVADRWLAQ